MLFLLLFEVNILTPVSVETGLELLVADRAFVLNFHFLELLIINAYFALAEDAGLEPAHRVSTVNGLANRRNTIMT